ncbi:hypothetical protein ACQ4PT_006759 [Festuca glaucescens]
MGKGEEAGEEKGRKKMTKGGKAPFHDMFKNADVTDMVLMLVGTVAAVASGMSQVVMTIIFGRMIDAFGGATPDTILPRVNKVVLQFVYLAIGTLPACFLGREVSTAYHHFHWWVYCGVHQRLAPNHCNAFYYTTISSCSWNHLKDAFQSI